MKPLLLLPLAVSLAVFPAGAEEEVPPRFEQGDAGSQVDPFDPLNSAPRLIRMQVEHIELSHKDLTRLMMEDDAKTADAKALRKKVQELVGKDEAKVIDTQIVTGRSGQRQKVESIHEFIYPTEYEPPELPADLQENPDRYTKLPIGAYTPTAFEMRNLGSEVTLEPVASNEWDLVDLIIESELDWHTGNKSWAENKDALGNIHKVEMPDFYSMNLTTTITCIPGQHVLVAALSPKDAEGKMDADRKVMVFVKCDVLPVVP